MRISYETVTAALGPGRRYVIWVQGCDKRCKGCINPAGWSKEAGNERAVDELYNTIIGSPGISGITISGGEPFLQFDELKELITLVKNRTELDVMVYTGFKAEELSAMFGCEFDALKEYIDILVDGEYIESRNYGEMYRGSDNQRIFFFTEKYRRYADKILHSKQRNFSFKILDNGEVYFIGIPPVGFYERFIKKLGGE